MGGHGPQAWIRLSSSAVLALSIGLTLPSVAQATAYVKSFEYVEIVLDPGQATDSVPLTKSQNIADCVPFASAMGDPSANTFGSLYADVYFTSGPATVHAQRTLTTGTLTVGVYVVEFDPAYIKVQNGTYTLGSTVVVPITPVAANRAALVFYSRNDLGVGGAYESVKVRGRVDVGDTDVSFRRYDATGTVTGNWYVFEALNNSGYAFTVEARHFGGLSSVLSAAVPEANTLIVGSYQVLSNQDLPSVGEYTLDLSGCGGGNCTSVAVTAFNTSAVRNTSAYVINWASGLQIQRGTFNLFAGVTQATATLSPHLAPARTMVWNVMGGGPGGMRANQGSGSQMYQAHQRVFLPANDTVQSNRGSTGSTAAGMWQAVEWETVITAVTLQLFDAIAMDGAVELRWETASELNNLGFDLYRATDPEGPFQKVTERPIPGLGSSPAGASYLYRDEGRTNGVTYYYRLEDIETTGKTEQHGPVAATPQMGDGTASEVAPELITVGAPDTSRLRILEQSNRRIVVELTTGGFEAMPQADGTVEVTVPGFVTAPEETVPIWRSWLETPSRRELRVGSVLREDVQTFSSLTPSADEQEIRASRNGTVRLRPRRTRSSRKSSREPARLVSQGYQGDVRKALLELSPLQWDGKALSLAGKLTVTLELFGPELSPRRRARQRRAAVWRRLVTREPGLYELRFDELSGGRRRALATSELRLSRLGEPVAYHVEPDDGTFGPGSRLYFFSEGSALNSYGDAAVYELERAPGTTMAVTSSPPSGKLLDGYWHRIEQEENHYYQAGLLESEDLWMWDLLLSPVTKSYAFDVVSLRASNEPSQLSLSLQGASAFPGNPDHHVRIFVNDSFVGESTFDGKSSEELHFDIPPGVLKDGANELILENVGDTAAAYSMVMLNRFAVTHPRNLSEEQDVMDGAFLESGQLDLAEFSEPPIVVDLTDNKPRWLGKLSRLTARSGRRYLAVSPAAVLLPEVRTGRTGRLRSEGNQADYLLIGPEGLLDAAKPLLDLRRRQGLRSRAVSVEDIYSEFGYGEPRPEAIHEFLAYAYHDWQKPSPRYVLLLGDATYDFKDYLQTGVRNHVPPQMVKTSYLWTASDPAYASVNGEDDLPDFAIGRLPASDREEARVMVEKVLQYEASEHAFDAPAILVADNPDEAGDFEADTDALAAGVLAPYHPQKIYLKMLGADATRSAIRDAFDAGAGLVSYVGHGGIHLWASENIFEVADVRALSDQSRQPLLLTMNCLNGYFHFPYFNSLSEELVKTEGKGVIAAFSPSGLSLDAPAAIFHHALLGEVLSGEHHRLGDALLAAQETYARSGAFPELLSIYHLLGDPALSLR